MRPVQRQKSDGTALFDKERFKKHCMNFRLAAGSRLFSRRQSDRAVFTNEPWANLQPVSGRREWSHRSEEHTSELQSLMRISYAVFCLKKKKEDTNEYTVIQ